MVIDTSALLAIAFGEPEASRFIKAIAEAAEPVIGAPTLVEAAAVLMARTGPEAEVALDALLHQLGIAVVPMTPRAAEAARHAYARYGKGVGRPGVLNFGDSLSYGVAVDRGVSLLFKGDDFPKTDIDQAKY
ncbi:MAG TPA: type II toxin-antitoxin system VapC family toxin [Longimicrobium sp.]|jgi:ribonuclease VapC